MVVVVCVAGGEEEVGGGVGGGEWDVGGGRVRRRRTEVRLKKLRRLIQEPSQQGDMSGACTRKPLSPRKMCS